MARFSLNDQAPGGPVDARRLPEGAVVLIIAIVDEPPAASQFSLILRCEPDGQILAALSKRRTDEGNQSA